MQRSSYLFKNKQLCSQRYVFRTVPSNAATKEDVELKSWKEIPGPSSLPLVGPLRHFVPGGFLYQHDGKLLREKLYQTFGDIVRMDAVPGLNTMLFLFDPESVSKILRGENQFPIRPGMESIKYYRKINDRFLGLSGDGEDWRKLRSTVDPVLLFPKTVKLYASILDDVAQDMVKRIRNIEDDENKIKNTLLQEINLWALESIGTVTLGCRMGCLAPNLSDDSPVNKLIKCNRGFVKAMNELHFKPNIWKYVPTKSFKKTMELYKDQESLCKYFIDKSIKERNKRNAKGIFEKLMDINEEMAYAMATDLLTVGVDTTANTMMATLYLLAANPEKQHKLREELKSDQRPYLKACIRESLRMMPSPMVNARVTTKEHYIRGYKIPIGVCTIFCHEEMSLMEKHFMKSKEYIPERWLADSTDPLCYRNAHPFTHMPFGFGVRGCIGRRIAHLELESLLARVIENFHLEWNGRPPKIHSCFINYMEGPYNFKIQDLRKLSSF